MRHLIPPLLLALLTCAPAAGSGFSPNKTSKAPPALDNDSADDPKTSIVPPSRDGAQSAAAVLEGDLGLPALEALERRAILLTTGSSKPRRVAAISWDALERHIAAAPRLVAFLEAYQAVRKGGKPAGTADTFQDLRNLPPGGLLANASRAALAALGEHAAAIRDLSDAAPALIESGSFYRTAWGKAISERTHSELGGSALGAGAEALFAALSAPGAPAGISAHFSKWLSARDRAPLDELRAADASAGRLSEKLKGAFEDYLADQGRVEAVLSARDRLSRLESDSEARRLFDDLRAAAPRLVEAGDLSVRLKEILAEKNETPTLTLNVPELHLRPSSEAPLEAGDEMIISVAYWIDGLPSNQDAEVAEVLYRDDGDQGLALLSRTVSKRRAGGPYSLMLKTSASASGRPTYRLVLDAAGAVPAVREVSAEVSDALDGLRLAAAEAEALGRACRLEDSSVAWKNVLEKLGADNKPARVRLAASARRRLKAVEGWTILKRQLDESLDGARLFATKEHCDYRTERAERAMSLLKSLPAGCDREITRAENSDVPQAGIAEELSRLSRDTDARRRLQEGFRATVSRARDREASCKPDEAATLYAAAMVLLDSDPDARCGDFEKEYAAVRMEDLPRAAAADRLGAAIETELGRARRQLASEKASSALATALPLATALGRLPDARCWSGPIKSTAELAQAAGVALGPPPVAGLRLAPDPASAIIDEARQDWERRRSETDFKRNEAESVQAPNAAGEAQ